MAVFTPSNHVFLIKSPDWTNLANVRDSDISSKATVIATDNFTQFPVPGVYFYRGYIDQFPSVDVATFPDRFASVKGAYAASNSAWDVVSAPFRPKAQVLIRWDGTNPWATDFTSDFTAGTSDWSGVDIRSRNIVVPGESLELTFDIPLTATTITTDLVMGFNFTIDWTAGGGHTYSNGTITWDIFESFISVPESAVAPYVWMFGD